MDSFNKSTSYSYCVIYMNATDCTIHADKSHGDKNMQRGPERMHKEELTGSRTIYEGKIITLKACTVRLENGAEVLRELVEHPGGVGILALDEEENVLLVRQYRFGAGQVLLELPAGKLEPGEDPAQCGMRELEEETGCCAASFAPLGRIHPTPAYVSEVIYIFLARGLTHKRQSLDADEFLTVEKVPLRQAVQLCLDGGITDAKTVFALLKYSALQKQ